LIGDKAPKYEIRPATKKLNKLWNKFFGSDFFPDQAIFIQDLDDRIKGVMDLFTKIDDEAHRASTPFLESLYSNPAARKAYTDALEVSADGIKATLEIQIESYELVLDSLKTRNPFEALDSFNTTQKLRNAVDSLTDAMNNLSNDADLLIKSIDEVGVEVTQSSSRLVDFLAFEIRMTLA